MKRVRLVVVTGLSGSGKTAALKALEDLGFFCVDNLPAPLLPKFLELSVLSGGEIRKVAVGMDLRERHFLDRRVEAFGEVARLGIRAEILYLEASDGVLVRRFSETRRRHPLAGDRSVTHGIRAERLFLEEIKGGAHRVIDTSEMNVHDLKKALWEYFREGPESHTLQVNLVSFGYRYGIPYEADILLDVRFLPNPHFVDGLKHHVGTEKSVQDFVLQSEESKEFLHKVSDLIAYLLPLYEKEGKTYVTVAIGCTGGKHRSVTLVEELKRRLAGAARPIQTLHRDIKK